MKPIKAVIHRKIEGKVKSITLSKDCCGDYWASVLYENDEAEAAPETVVHESQILGLDAGLKTFCTCSNGKKVKSPKPLKWAMKKLNKVNVRCRARRRAAKTARRLASVLPSFIAKRQEFVRTSITKLLDDWLTRTKH